MKARAKPLIAVAVGIAALALAAFYFGRRAAPVRYLTATADRGEIVEVVGATGTLEAVTTVQVGSQVSGIIQSLFADFNSQVKKGAVIARLDPSTFEARLNQARANLMAARANAERASAELVDATQKRDRAVELFEQKLLPQSDLETAKANFDTGRAQLKAAQAAVSQAEANVNQAKVDLDHTVITAPIDGIVISRNVDVGQTVAASLQAPVLFAIANDLSRMQVNAAIDEADIGRVKAGQDVTFRVDAYPDRQFRGKVEQVRLQPTVAQNVVTYNTIIAVENDEQMLMPGMTATVSVIVERASDAVRVPSAALRFRPEGLGRGAATGERDGGGSRPPGSEEVRASEEVGRTPSEETAGSSGRSGLVFVLDEPGKPRPVRVRVGISDGTFTEVLDGLAAGTAVITGTETRGSTGQPQGASPSTNPFSPQRQRRTR